MVDWNTGAPNARFRVLELLKNNFAPGDRIVDAQINTPYITTLAVTKPDGSRKLLLVNKRDRAFHLALPQRAKAVTCVDQTTKGAPPAHQALNSDQLDLHGLGVAVVDF
jgi:hypothetical protein